jgi:lysophospholipase L1-like esterase
MRNYLALGDSISIDDYPDLEVGSKGNGAASLLAEKIQPEKFVNLTQDGATIDEIFQHQLLPATKLLGKVDPVLITITAGGNDISFGVMKLKSKKQLDKFQALVYATIHNYANLVLATRRMFPNSIIVVNTLYDPTDGTEKLPENCGLWADIAPLYSQGRRQLGEFIRAWSEKVNFLNAVDIFKEFDGKGMKIQNKLGYYYNPFLIEPGAVGAREISELWYDKVVDLL